MNNSGYLLNQRYRLIDQIGEGGMANVYLALDTILDRQVAIKVLRGDLSHDELFVKRFQREALAATTLNHPNLVSVYDVGEEKGYHYIVMEYIKGKTLKQLVKERGPLNLDEVIDIMKQLTNALEHAHSRKIIHRDIKPQNVIVKSDGTVKLTDFGIAIAQNSAQLTQTNSVMGSVHYLAPELAKGEQATVQSDIYALGIIMYEILVGDVPYAGESAVNIALMHMQKELPSIKEVLPTIPQAVENIVIKATVKNRHYRYDSVNDMFLDIQTCLDASRMNEPRLVFKIDEDESKTVLIDRTSLMNVNQQPVQPNKESKKNKYILWGVLSTLLALLIGFFVFTSFSNSESTVPNVAGMTLSEAIQVLQENNYIVDEEYTFEVSKDVESDLVINTSPEIGSTLAKHSKVKLIISKGNVTELPSLIGKSISDAKVELAKLGITPRVEEKESDKETGTVIDMLPQAGVEVNNDTEVILWVAKNVGISMPNVVGLTYKEGLNKLESMSLIVDQKNCVTDSIIDKQSSAPGKVVKAGDKVTLTCPVEEKPTEQTPTQPNEQPSSEEATS